MIEHRLVKGKCYIWDFSIDKEHKPSNLLFPSDLSFQYSEKKMFNLHIVWLSSKIFTQDFINKH